MLYEIMLYLHNFFVIDGKQQSGTFTIDGGSITLPFLQTGQYFLITGSVFNDGVYQYGAAELTDETFEGDIAPLAPPKTFLNLAEEISEWQTQNAQSACKPYQSESFNGYSYTRATGKDGGAITWKDVYAARLKAWRKI